MKLIVLEGPAASPEYVVEQPEAVIGRAPECDVMVFDAQVSRRHARLVRADRHADRHYVIESLQPDNPTIVNDRYLGGPRRLHDGDLIVVGGVVLVVEIEDDDLVTSKGWSPTTAPESPNLPEKPIEAARDALRSLASRFGDAARRLDVRAGQRRAGAGRSAGADDRLVALLADHEALGGDAELARLAALLSERLGNQTDISALYRLGAETSSLIAWSRIARRSMAEAIRLADALGIR